ncbi:hypothetical protein EW146_g1185 [Bondarzewia mesenterica]|uniref:Chromatin modification-related protein EAF7 n=1 Tax=Bondarzewia mesenterica TaxID=1095465 RepID=A0A4V3XG51_9AGAM|nr:hypothetical protein EW146_g1185 [Bondarzewia mesenterica]
MWQSSQVAESAVGTTQYSSSISLRNSDSLATRIMTVNDKSATSKEFLSTVEGEISFFRSLMRARPIGLHRHFHVLSMRNAIHKDTGQSVSIDEIWEKLRSCYDLDALENLETEGYESPGSSRPHSQLARSPSPSQNLFAHPFFRNEFSLPSDESFESIISVRRTRGSTSPQPSVPSPMPPTKEVGSRGKKRGRSKVNMAGLVGGDSDSSALTQESGDESVAPTPRGSVVTGTDAGTEYGEDEDVDMDAGPSKAVRGKATKATRKGGTSRGRTAPVRPVKKRKR